MGIAAVGLACAAESDTSQSLYFPPPAGPVSVGKDLTETLTGDYQLAELDLAGCWGLNKESARLILGLREQHGVMAWIASSTTTGRGNGRGWVREITVKRTGERLSGNIHLGEIIGPSVITISLDTTISGTAISGSYTVRFTGKVPFGFVAAPETTGAVAGRLIAAKEPLRTDQHWPWHFGEGGSYRGPDSNCSLITDLALAKPVWKSEEPLGCGWGNNSSAIDFHATNNRGGSATPVVADGRVYVCHYVPARGKPFDGRGIKVRGDYEAIVKEWKAVYGEQVFPQEKVDDLFREKNDTVVACLDGATGQTLWRTTLSARFKNVQQHKWRGMNPSPTVAGGRVFVFDLEQHMAALDAKTGKVLWEYTSAKQRGAPALGPGACVIGETVTHLGLAGMDVASGKLLWEAKCSPWACSTALPWRDQERTSLILLNAAPHSPVMVQCVDPLTGKQAWEQPSALVGDNDLTMIADGILIGCAKQLDAKLNKQGEGSGGGGALIAYRLATDGMKEIWRWNSPVEVVDRVGMAAGTGRVYVSAFQSVFCLDLATGKELARADGAGGARNQAIWLADNRLFINTEGRHGGYCMQMLTSDPSDFRVLDPTKTMRGKTPAAHPEWDPPHAHTTAYANMGTPSPVVDGRMFMRGRDAIYCYDLRAPAKKP
ncbi:hypothetical protein LBMAG53_20090 [Planctomycetota bacterium]|nr:hypothetical protein LBMAG53_20090 [Planctomycetota bacterium]